jgi:hypothetical protein
MLCAHDVGGALGGGVGFDIDDSATAGRDLGRVCSEREEGAVGGGTMPAAKAVTACPEELGTAGEMGLSSLTWRPYRWNISVRRRFDDDEVWVSDPYTPLCMDSGVLRPVAALVERRGKSLRCSGSSFNQKIELAAAAETGVVDPFMLNGILPRSSFGRIVEGGDVQSDALVVVVPDLDGMTSRVGDGG